MEETLTITHCAHPHHNVSVFPGKKNAGSASQFAFHFMKNVISKIDYLVDIHTASFGRANSFYVRANMNDELCHRLAILMRPEIIVHR